MSESRGLFVLWKGSEKYMSKDGKIRYQPSIIIEREHDEDLNKIILDSVVASYNSKINKESTEKSICESNPLDELFS